MRDKLAYEWGIPIAISLLLVGCVGWLIVLFSLPRQTSSAKSEGIINE